ncbi:hypothetical protein EVAR_67154_1 [Eumeta japonica]|uniref:Uncharacterized protein n=1 Tax=Eumeta variegata TaxID=151549 RepID=A0A4C1ZRR5_EUMVA|nr:hypothetical protein EVAR_67154_1 [Eumeta japonica]
MGNISRKCILAYRVTNEEKSEYTRTSRKKGRKEIGPCVEERKKEKPVDLAPPELGQCAGGVCDSLSNTMTMSERIDE